MQDFIVGDWTVKPALNRLSRGDTEVTAEPRVIAALIALNEARGEVLAKDDFAAKVWNRDVVSDDAILKVISKTRLALGDDPQKPRYIETVRGRGYRLLSQDETAPEARSRHSRNAYRRMAVAAGIAVIAAGGAFLAGAHFRDDTPKVIFLEEDSGLRVINEGDFTIQSIPSRTDDTNRKNDIQPAGDTSQEQPDPER